MEIVERRYRDTTKENKEYTRRLAEYIDFLRCKGRILEAKYFFSLFDEEVINNPAIIRLGYSLSIASFDREGVIKFDELLRKSMPSNIELCCFHLEYYISVNDLENCEKTSEFLLSNFLPKECLDIVIEACINLQSYSITANLAKYLEKVGLEIDSLNAKEIKKIAYQRLVKSIERLKFD